VCTWVASQTVESLRGQMKDMERAYLYLLPGTGGQGRLFDPRFKPVEPASSGVEDLWRTELDLKPLFERVMRQLDELLAKQPEKAREAWKRLNPPPNP